MTSSYVTSVYKLMSHPVPQVAWSEVPGGEVRAVWGKCVVSRGGQGSGAAPSSKLAAKLAPTRGSPSPTGCQQQPLPQGCAPGMPGLLWAQAACPCPRTGAHRSSQLFCRCEVWAQSSRVALDCTSLAPLL